MCKFSKLNTELFIAKKIISNKDGNNRISRPIIKIAIIGIALGLTVMIASVAIVTGFKNQIRTKVIGFGSHVQIVNYDSNSSYETLPIDKNQPFYPFKNDIKGVKHIQIFVTKAGIIKTENDIQGAVLKGVGSDFDWSFFNKNLVEGKSFEVTDSVKSNNLLISQSIANLLKLKIGDAIEMYFIQDPPRMRKFNICGIYKTSLEDFDKLYVLVDIKHIQKLNGWDENQISGFEVITSDFDKIDEVAEEINFIVANNFNEDGSTLKAITIKEKFPQLFDWLELQNMNVWVILILMVIVAGFNMVSGFLILILEQTNMIGILKSLGSNNISIRKIFLYNASYLTAVGLFWGNIIGISLCVYQYYTGFFKLDSESYYVDVIPINIEVLDILMLNIGTMLITVIMLLIPSMIISKISPLKAIQFE